MLTFISCAKTMTARSNVRVPFTTVPPFETAAKEHALNLSQFSTQELEKLLHINSKLAAANYLRYQDFCSDETPALPALLSYTGMVFKRINPKDFTEDDFRYAQEHLLITSFLYGLLRPLDAIKNYRLEGDVKLPELGGISFFDYWKPKLTDFFIDTIRKQGGILINLASGEMKDLFDWEKVNREVQVITPEFHTWKNGKLATVVVYAKMCRGEMTRFILKNRIENPEDLKGFEWEGFRFSGTDDSGKCWDFVLG
ncbi:peroxide stress protein YaaA [Phocaeicola barnesiae]|uniref:peroxide stress protein YaaA n=1 Tax=Phocaeicola barnesiae TaxID=376804 RepID=UPI0025A49D78|nr:peroxide stress protein YaaA [Phocaeicola barnesiae]MDM8242934.1 peroxide stress protein YaaA [Phocaeicola barnesiae]